MDRREFFAAGIALANGGPLFGSPRAAAAADEGSRSLYNGIQLPTPWPPQRSYLTLDAMPVPYLESPPKVIPIDIGRQLFVDDFLIHHSTLRRSSHSAEYHPANPVLRADRSWEQSGRDAIAMVFSDGVWYDPGDRLFKMWYMGGLLRSTCYAVSQDGIHWEKPKLDVQPGTNVVHAGRRDSSTVWLDLQEMDPKRRYKMFRSHGDGGWALSVHFSADGIHWSDAVCRSGPCGDRTTVFYNPFRKVWVYSIRDDKKQLGRMRTYRENRDVLAGAGWKAGEPVSWVAADRLDPERADLRVRPQLYNLDAVAYESVLLGLFGIWRGQPRDRPKPNEIVAGFSRDGFHWRRPERHALIPVSERLGDWNWGNVQSAGGCCLVAGDRLYFYVSGRAGIRGSPTSGVSTTGLATLRRDGFASMDAGLAEGSLVTRPVCFRGCCLFVNLAAAKGDLRVEVLDREGQVIEPFSRDNCERIRADQTLKRVQWKGSRDLSALAGKPVRFRFLMTQGRLYSFWVSAKTTGASNGYVGAGGPGFTGPTDTIGSAS
jgi:hypothetical protein